MLDTEQANARIAQLESFIDELTYNHQQDISKIQNEHRELLDRARETAYDDLARIRELEQQVEALQTELDQLKNP